MGPARFRKLAAVLDRRQPDLTVLMERVHKVHNLSAILRSCDAAGVLRAHAVLPDSGRRVSHRTSAGARKWVEVVRHDSVAEAVRSLEGDDFQVVAAHPSPRSVDYTEVDYTRPTAIMVGAELHGLDERALELAHVQVRIPMVGMVQSLNVSVATALILYEAARQRKLAGLYDRCRIPEDERSRVLFEWAYPRIAERYREQDLPYPPVDEDGRILVDG